MAKKDKKGTEGAVQNREIFQRMNFLYQAAMCMATITCPSLTNFSTSTQMNLSGGGQSTIKQPDTSIATTTPSTTTISNSEDSTIASEVVAPVAIDIEMRNSTNSSIAADMEDVQQAAAEEITKVTDNITTRSDSRRKLSRRQKRELLRLRKTKIAMEQISQDETHQSLINKKVTLNSKKCDLYPLSGTARFYASTLREVGRKNVIRIGPVIKRSICQRCEAILIPSISCEVRIQSMPQLHTQVICTACGAFRRYYCMPGKGVEGDRWELDRASTEVAIKKEETIEAEEVEAKTMMDST
ncbi:Ribonuclease P protein subunit p21 [Lobosporangium transversale]|uniref:RNAse P Rpr2/Rpp21/SNM1 subunit domain-domain-containing protein n=1 Tax=Lobosporangium transversale TaxID=64571 RepID=A0A1Y2H2C9_9FUNG|nr:hypothetical protein BCR41DRAFT_343934 [Lobosporangium transversale]KAF9916029.1 Ribonuclease P protein subunit p21 [Lobosporangium transversale]ORZ28708.1 hypothetical protein BCR41DRAFT_343934 [Lobosporangium transversale]|eukprot:XP_021886381.1 hypothetical protein BCR41DRAFT_343934 [Lobosporangium transversale]